MILSKKILTIVLIVIGICVAVYFFVIKNGTEPEEGELSQDATEETEKIAETPIPVKVDKARIGELIISLKSPGEAVTNRMVTIKSEVSGIIKKLNVEEIKEIETAHYFPLGNESWPESIIDIQGSRF